MNGVVEAGVEFDDGIPKRGGSVRREGRGVLRSDLGWGADGVVGA